MFDPKQAKNEYQSTKEGFNTLKDVYKKQNSRLEILQKKYANEHKASTKAKREIDVVKSTYRTLAIEKNDVESKFVLFNSIL